MTKAKKKKLPEHKYLAINKQWNDAYVFKDEADLEDYLEDGGTFDGMSFYLIGEPITVEVGKIKITVNK